MPSAKPVKAHAREAVIKYVKGPLYRPPALPAVATIRVPAWLRESGTTVDHDEHKKKGRTVINNALFLFSSNALAGKPWSYAKDLKDAIQHHETFTAIAESMEPRLVKNITQVEGGFAILVGVLWEYWGGDMVAMLRWLRPVFQPLVTVVGEFYSKHPEPDTPAMKKSPRNPNKTKDRVHDPADSDSDLSCTEKSRSADAGEQSRVDLLPAGAFFAVRISHFIICSTGLIRNVDDRRMTQRPSYSVNSYTTVSHIHAPQTPSPLGINQTLRTPLSVLPWEKVSIFRPMSMPAREEDAVLRELESTFAEACAEKAAALEPAFELTVHKSMAGRSSSSEEGDSLDFDPRYLSSSPNPYSPVVRAESGSMTTHVPYDLTVCIFKPSTLSGDSGQLNASY
ncbi:hypothetical protein C8R43DRAFT_962641 [Mycena crocata]|nr:hypothetical protein C8R43DRAFT_962641 [Mycena crocata]